jgi:glutathione peroxidase
MISAMSNLHKNQIFAVAALALILGSSTLCCPWTTGLAQPCSAATDKGKDTSAEKGKTMSDLYNFKEKALDGKEIDFKTYEGDVLLIVNTASKCGFTPQYAGLEELSKKYSAKGLKVLGFPCNQFGQQEPGDSSEIHSFCQKNYGVDFQLFEKIDVNGKDANPLYVYLKKQQPGDKGDIQWNFTKFLVDRKGNVVKRFESKTKPEELAPEVEKLLN